MIKRSNFNGTNSGQFRTEVFIEDLKKVWVMSMVEEFKLWELHKGDKEHQEVLTSTVRAFPKSNLFLFYKMKIKGLKDKWLIKLLREILWMNPTPDEFSLKNITSNVIVFHCDEGSGITYENLRPIVDRVNRWEGFSMYEPTNRVGAIYSRSNTYSPSEKRVITRQASDKVVRDQLGNLLHDVVVTAADKFRCLKITNPSLVEVGSDMGSDKLTAYTVKKFTREDTKEHIEFVNTDPLRIAKQIPTAIKCESAVKLLSEGVTSIDTANKLMMSNKITNRLKKSLNDIRN